MSDASQYSSGRKNSSALKRAATERRELTPRQIEVLCLVASGVPNRRIGAELSICEQTVKNHLGTAMSKLGVDDRTHAVLKAIRLGIIRIPSDPDVPLVGIPIGPDLVASKRIVRNSG